MSSSANGGPTVTGFEAVAGGALMAADEITTLQINIGLRCNLACKHCHVESSPKRIADHENMTAEVATRVLEWLERAPTITTVDLTGGSPEMNPNFRRVVQTIRDGGRHVIDRCNPTILAYQNGEERYDWVPEFLSRHAVEVYASLPCYLPENVRAQRGLHAYDASIEGLRRLCDVGYGRDPALPLNLVFNPIGAKLPPPTESLETAYRDYLSAQFDLAFTRLVTITNMPIARWADHLRRRGELSAYNELLVNSFNPATLDGLMCRHQIHIDSKGRMHDCDFNFAAEMPAEVSGRFLWDEDPETLAGRRIATADHCFGCTAGSGSSCGGSLASATASVVDQTSSRSS